MANMIAGITVNYVYHSLQVGCVLYVGEFCSSKQFYYVEAQVQLESHKSNPLKNLLSAILCQVMLREKIFT
jgi:hypothetical protein